MEFEEIQNGQEEEGHNYPQLSSDQGNHPNHLSSVLSYRDLIKLALAMDEVYPGGKTRLVFSLRAFATVFLAQVFAIMASIREIIARGYNGKTITIFTDSQAV